MSALLPVILTASQLILTAQDVPQLNVEPSCRSAADAVIRQQDRTADACLRDEQQTRDSNGTRSAALSRRAACACPILAVGRATPSC